MAWIWIPKGKSHLKDASGERVYFDKPYFDQAFRRKFNTIEEKAEFMNKIGAVSVGDSDAKAARQKRELIEKKYDTNKETRKGYKKES